MNVCVYMLLLAIAAAPCSAAPETPSFQVTTHRDNDQVDVRTEKDLVLFSIHSPFGISKAVIRRKGEKWPKAVVLHLHLTGLESFSASNGKVQLHASVSSQDRNVRLWKDGRDTTPLQAESPYRFEVRMVGGDGKAAKTIPLQDGHFEVRLPRAFFEGNPTSITVNWIDFYRN